MNRRYMCMVLVCVVVVLATAFSATAQNIDVKEYWLDNGMQVLMVERHEAPTIMASIIAKVTRDRLMQKYHHYYPQFDFPKHKGYPTAAHREAIRKFGCCPIHRKSFKGVKEFIYAKHPAKIRRTR